MVCATNKQLGTLLGWVADKVITDIAGESFALWVGVEGRGKGGSVRVGYGSVFSTTTKLPSYDSQSHDSSSDDCGRSTRVCDVLT